MNGLRHHLRNWSSENAHMIRVLLPFTALVCLMLAAVHFVPHGLHPMTYHGHQVYPSQLDRVPAKS
jgi:hypothetical protein